VSRAGLDWYCSAANDLLLKKELLTPVKQGLEADLMDERQAMRVFAFLQAASHVPTLRQDTLFYSGPRPGLG